MLSRPTQTEQTPTFFPEHAGDRDALVVGLVRIEDVALGDRQECGPLRQIDRRVHGVRTVTYQPLPHDLRMEEPVVSGTDPINRLWLLEGCSFSFWKPGEPTKNG